MAGEFGKLFGRFLVTTSADLAWRLPVTAFVRWQVQVQERGIKLAAEQEASLLIPAERRTVPPTVAGERFKFPGRVRQFQDTRHQPIVY